MENEKSKIPIVGGLFLPQCRYMIAWSIPFSMLLATPFAMVFTYYNTQNQKKFLKWDAKLFGRDLLIFCTVFSVYTFFRTLAFDPYCDCNSVHYDKKLNAFERKKMVTKYLKQALESEGKIPKVEENDSKNTEN